MGTKTQKLSNTVDSIVEWQSVVVADGSTNTTAVAGEGYFINTSSGAHTINLPASPKQGDVVKVSIITAGNAVTIGRNGNNINGAASDLTISVDGDVKELVYVDSSEGWKTVGQVLAGAFTEATGGTETTDGDYKVHTFTGDGCFVVTQVGNSPVVASGGPSDVSYLVIAGGGGGGARGGGGAGGYREQRSSPGDYPGSPAALDAPFTITAQTYPITVGAGGAGDNGPCGGGEGSNSVFSTITSAGGGGGATSSFNGADGGSGGGGGVQGGPTGSGGAGNTPPVSPPQGKPGGNGGGSQAGGGGGIGTGGTNGDSPAPNRGHGGQGIATSITGCEVKRAAGGGGGADTPAPACAQGLGGAANTGVNDGGGGGDGGTAPGGVLPTAGTANKGGGGGGAGASSSPSAGSSGGKGIVVIRYKYQ